MDRLAVAALAPSTAPEGAGKVGGRFGLPDLPGSFVALSAALLSGRPVRAGGGLSGSRRPPRGRRSSPQEASGPWAPCCSITFCR